MGIVPQSRPSPPSAPGHSLHNHHAPPPPLPFRLCLHPLQDPDKLQQLVSSVSTLAQDSKQLQAVTAELSSDVKQTVNTIREAEQQAASGSSTTTGR